MKLHIDSIRVGSATDEDSPKPEGADFCVGIYAQAWLRISLDDIPEGYVEKFRITSMGIWGIDDEAWGMNEYADEELSQLREMLEAFGLDEGVIDAAFASAVKE